jgi:SAM-dependent methyltransferase
MKSYREIYRVEQLPVFQNRMFHSEEEGINCVKGDVVLVQDLETGLIFNQAFNPDLMQYNTDYQNEQAISVVFQQHLQNVSAIIQTYFDRHTLIEVGCGKGYFLEQLQRLGFQITGFDPTYEGLNPAVIKKYFNPEAGLKADGILLRHVLEHVQDPVRFLTKIRDANGGGGKIYIEVPCFDWICEHRVWFDIFYEHVNYFRLTDFHRMFDTVYKGGHTFDGQYLYVVADLASIKNPAFNKLDQVDFPEKFLDSVAKNTAKINSALRTPHSALRTPISYLGRCVKRRYLCVADGSCGGESRYGD